MLATSMAPPLPHLLSRLDRTSPLSVLPPENVQPLDPLSSAKRPKLSLKTSELAPTFHGSTSRQNGITTDTTATPTTLNTFANTFDLTYRPSPGGPHSQRRSSAYTSPTTGTADLPYNLNLPFGVHSILKNGPLARDVRRSSFSASPRVSGRRVFFPTPKKVTFRAELEDEIVTKQYVIRHTDLSSSEDESTPSESDEQSGTSNDDEENEGKERPIRLDEVSVRGRRKRKIVAISATEVAPDREERSRSTSAPRSKRKRRSWEWRIESKNSSRAVLETNPDDVKEDQVSTLEKRTTSPGTGVAQALEKMEQAQEHTEAENPLIDRRSASPIHALMK